MDKNKKITGIVPARLQALLKKLSTIDLFNCLDYVEKLLAERQERIVEKDRIAKNLNKKRPNIK